MHSAHMATLQPAPFVWLRVHHLSHPLSSVTLRTVRLSVRLGSPVTEPTALHYRLRWIQPANQVRLPTLSRSHCTAPSLYSCSTSECSFGRRLWKLLFVNEIIMNAPPIWTWVHLSFLQLQRRGQGGLMQIPLKKCVLTGAIGII